MASGRDLKFVAIGHLLPFPVASEISSERPFAPGVVDGFDAHRTVDGKPAAVRPLRHRLCIIARQQATSHEHAQQAPAHLRLHLGDGGGIEAGGGMEDDPGRGEVEHAVDDDTMKDIRIPCTVCTTTRKTSNRCAATT
jgi:hypothetical protein